VQLVTNHVRIAGTGSAVPSTRVSNSELVEGLATTDTWIRENLGIHERRIARFENESTSGLAGQAALRAITAAGLSPNDVGGLIVATATPDQKAPSTACLVQDDLGIRNGSFAFDVNAVCSGFLYAVGVAASMIDADAADNIVVVGADTFSTITDWTDRACVFFGDGAGAVVLQREARGDGLLALTLHADGRGREGFFVPTDGSCFSMDPHAVFETGTSVLPEAIRTVLALADKKLNNIGCVIPHQPSQRVLDETAHQLGIPPARILRNMDRYANTAGGTIPLLLDEVVQSGKLAEGDEFLMAAVGSGWTWGAAVARWGSSSS
jgi:3-oxoacyl-[acyl-carrier-protein] synthase-3